jgi:hypothetical protein
MKTQKQVEAIEDTLTDTITKLTEDGHQEIHVLETMLGLPGAPIMAGPGHWPGCSAISPMSAIGVPMPPCAGPVKQGQRQGRRMKEQSCTALSRKG